MIEKDELTVRFGILGGTFDPVHAGHADLACGAAAALGLDSILFIPNANPPHKPGSKITPYEHRVRMLALTLDDCEAGELCEVEARRSAPNYTIDTLANLRRLYGKDAEFFLLLGSDEVRDLAKWKEPRKLIETVKVVVVSRVGSEIAQIERLGNSLGKDAVQKLKANALYLEIQDVSSTQIRRKVARGEDLGRDVHPRVAAYIMEHNLYREEK